MILGNMSDLSTLLAPGDLAVDGTERTSLGRRFVRAAVIVAVTGFWISGLIR